MPVRPITFPIARSTVRKIRRVSRDNWLPQAIGNLELTGDGNQYMGVQFLKLDTDTGFRDEVLYPGRLRDYSTNGTVRDPLPPYAAEYNGSSQYSACDTDVHPLVSATACTMAAWVYMSADGSTPTIIGGDDASGGDTVDLSFSLTSRRLQFTVEGSGIIVDAGDAISTSTWHHVAATAEQNGADVDVELFIDGSSVKTGTISSKVLANLWAATAVVGASDGGGASIANFFPGYLQDVHLYDAVMTTAYIAELATPGLPPSVVATSLVAMWPLEESMGVVGYDITTSANHLTHVDGVDYAAAGRRSRNNEYGYRETEAYLTDSGGNYLVDSGGNRIKVNPKIETPVVFE